jgi:hypothetical protein
MPAAAIAAASAAAGLGGAAIQSSSANSASKAAQNAAANSLNFQKDVYSQAQTNLNPYAQTGQQANSALANLLGYGGNTQAQTDAFKNYLGSTNYNFVKDQGLQGIEYANAPQFNSSATAKALDQYNTGLAGNALAGYENLLQGQSGQGIQAASALAGTGTNLAGVNAQSNQYGANAQGQAAAATGNAWTSALGTLGKAASSYSTTPNAFGGLFASPSSGTTMTAANAPDSSASILNGLY